MKKITALLLIWVLHSCDWNSNGRFDSCTVYALDHPNKTWYLPSALNEISGIALSGGQCITAVNDEKGILYLYDLKGNNITAKINFGNDGDFEDVAVFKNTAFVLRSDGVLFVVANYKTDSKIQLYSTFLDKKDNLEGLYHDAAQNRLLLACKGNSKGGDYRNVYSFLLDKKQLNPDPELIINQETIKKKYGTKRFFEPSAIAKHPIRGTFFIITSSGKMMAEYSATGTLLYLYDLKYPHFVQPEGISFDSNGDLYISNEAKKKQATILKFSYRK
jgi:uncharacterized protein YjiK